MNASASTVASALVVSVLVAAALFVLIAQVGTEGASIQTLQSELNSFSGIVNGTVTSTLVSTVRAVMTLTSFVTETVTTTSISRTTSLITVTSTSTQSTTSTTSQFLTSTLTSTATTTNTVTSTSTVSSTVTRTSTATSISTTTVTLTTTVTKLTTVSGGPSSVSILLGSGSNTNTNGYSPAVLTVAVGVNNTVVWTNDDPGILHTVTSTSGTFSSGDLTGGQTYTFTFTTPGTYVYYCIYHSWMRGTVVVKSNP